MKRTEVKPARARVRKQIGEFELIDRLHAILDEAGVSGKGSAGLLIGIGDDCAAAERQGTVDLYKTDTMVDGVHFRSAQARWKDVGWKAMAVNQSDIASMGGTPRFAMITLGLPPRLDPEHVEEMYRGVAEACAENGGAVVGGDIVRSPVFFITVALTGEAFSGPGGRTVLLRRDAIRPGDLIGVTGPVGSSAGGLRAAEYGLAGAGARALMKTHFRPSPRMKEGRTLAESGVLAAMDISDGLVADLGKMCEASGVMARIILDDVPVALALKKLFPDAWQELALGGGEDYELLFAAPKDIMTTTLPCLGPGAAVIGEAVAARRMSDAGKAEVLDRAGSVVPVARGGWDHLEAAQ